MQRTSVQLYITTHARLTREPAFLSLSLYGRDATSNDFSNYQAVGVFRSEGLLTQTYYKDWGRAREVAEMRYRVVSSLARLLLDG